MFAVVKNRVIFTTVETITNQKQIKMKDYRIKTGGRAYGKTAETIKEIEDKIVDLLIEAEAYAKGTPEREKIKEQIKTLRDGIAKK